MRHNKAGVKLNRTTSHRQAMFRNMVTSLFKHERIRTTDVKAKELRRWADHIITLAKRGDLHARRQVLAIVREKEVAHKLFAEAQSRYGNINGGYTRIVKIGLRAGDAAPISLIELVAIEEKVKKAKKKGKGQDKKKSAAAKPAPAAAKEAVPTAEPPSAPQPPVPEETTPRGLATDSADAIQAGTEGASGVVDAADTAGQEPASPSAVVPPDEPESNEPEESPDTEKRDPQ